MFFIDYLYIFIDNIRLCPQNLAYAVLRKRIHQW